MNQRVVAEARRARARALRAQAEALMAEASALEVEANALEDTSIEPEWMKPRASGLPATTLRRAVREGKIAAAKVGREHLVRTSDVRAFLESQRVRPKQTEPVGEANADPFEAARERARLRRTA